MRTRSLLAAATVSVGLAVPAEAMAVKNFRGKTEQQRTVSLQIADDNLLNTLRINWITRNCTQNGSRFQNITRFRRDYDESTPDRFRDTGAYTVRDDGGIRSRVSITLAGDRTTDPADPAAETWKGTFSARVTVRRRGKVIDRCRLRAIDWSATIRQ
jgi:hypothetical protein